MRSPLSLHSPSWLHRRHLGSPLWPVTDKSPLSPQSRLHLSSLGFPQALRFIISTHVGIGSISVICPLFLCILGWSHPLVQLSYFFFSFPFLFFFLSFFLFLSSFFFPPLKGAGSPRRLRIRLWSQTSQLHIQFHPWCHVTPSGPFLCFSSCKMEMMGSPTLRRWSRKMQPSLKYILHSITVNMVSWGIFPLKFCCLHFPDLYFHTCLWLFFGFCWTFVSNLSSSHSRFLPHGQRPHLFPLKHFLLWQILPFSKVRILLETRVPFLDRNHHPNFS